MKILHVIAGAPTGGAETFNLDAMTALHGAGVEQQVICRPHPRLTARLDELGIPYQTLSFNRMLKPLQSLQIKKAVNSSGADLVHAWMNRAASFMPSGLRVPVLGWFGGYYDLKNYKNCDFYMGVTRDIVRHIIESTKKPHRVFLGHTFGTLSEDASSLSKQEFGLPDEAKVILLLSRMHWKKGVDTLLEACKELDANVYCLLAGDGPELEAYEELAAKMGLAERVRFLGWRDDRRSLLALADVCVLPSRYEPFGTVIAEAWFAGVPLVATKAAGAKQYVQNRVNGLLCEIDDVAGLATCLREALTDQGLRKTIIAGGTEEYAKLFSKEVVTANLIAAYEEMIRVYEEGDRILDEENYALPTKESRFLSEKIASRFDLPLGEDRKSEALMAAKCYLADDNDISVAEDVAYIQAKGLFDFLVKKGNKTVIRKLEELEINRILYNENTLKYSE